MEITYVIQRFKDQVWLDVSSYTDEPEARAQLANFVKELAEVLGPYRLVRREETEI